MLYVREYVFLCMHLHFHNSLSRFLKRFSYNQEETTGQTEIQSHGIVVKVAPSPKLDCIKFDSSVLK